MRRLRDAGLRVTNLIGIGPFRLDDPTQWDEQRARVTRALDAAEALDAECMILTTGPAGSLTWEGAADALEEALAPVISDANAAECAVRSRAHELAACRRRLRALAAPT